MGATETALIIEMAKLSLQVYFGLLRQAGKTDEELEELYQEEKKKFEINHPSNLGEFE